MHVSIWGYALTMGSTACTETEGGGAGLGTQR